MWGGVIADSWIKVRVIVCCWLRLLREGEEELILGERGRMPIHFVRRLEIGMKEVVVDLRD